MNLSIFKKLLSPFFWWQVILTAIKEHWIYLTILLLIFNGSSLMRGELYSFIVQGSLSAAVVGVFFCIWIMLLFIKKVAFEPQFRTIVHSQTNYILAIELVGGSQDDESHKAAVISDDFSEPVSKLGLVITLAISNSTTVGIFYVWYLIANK